MVGRMTTTTTRGGRPSIGGMGSVNDSTSSHEWKSGADGNATNAMTSKEMRFFQKGLVSTRGRVNGNEQ